MLAVEAYRCENRPILRLTVPFRFQIRHGPEIDDGGDPQYVVFFTGGSNQPLVLRYGTDPR